MKPFRIRYRDDADILDSFMYWFARDVCNEDAQPWERERHIEIGNEIRRKLGLPEYTPQDQSAKEMGE